MLFYQRDGLLVSKVCKKRETKPENFPEGFQKFCIFHHDFQFNNSFHAVNCSDNDSLLSIITKYGFPIREIALLYQGLFDLFVKKLNSE